MKVELEITELETRTSQLNAFLFTYNGVVSHAAFFGFSLKATLLTYVVWLQYKRDKTYQDDRTLYSQLSYVFQFPI